MKRIDVVSAMIVHAGRMLLTQRKADKDFPFTWESPGGKVEDGETHLEAMRREILEELGVRVHSIDGPFWSMEFDGTVSRPDRTNIRLSFYETRLDAGDRPQPCEGQGMGWFTGEEFQQLTLAPGNQRAAYAILQRLAPQSLAEISDLGIRTVGHSVREWEAVIDATEPLLVAAEVHQDVAAWAYGLRRYARSNIETLTGSRGRREPGPR